MSTGHGPYTLSYPFRNYSNTVQAGAAAEVACLGDVSNTAINQDGAGDVDLADLDSFQLSFTG